MTLEAPRLYALKAKVQSANIVVSWVGENPGGTYDSFALEWKKADAPLSDWTGVTEVTNLDPDAHASVFIAKDDDTRFEYLHSSPGLGTYWYRLKNESITGHAYPTATVATDDRVATATAAASTKPDAPTFTATSKPGVVGTTEGEITIEFDAITGHRYELAWNTGTEIQLNAAAITDPVFDDDATGKREYAHTGLTLGLSYTYSIKAFATTGALEISDPSVATELATGQLTKPTNLEVFVREVDVATLSWEYEGFDIQGEFPPISYDVQVRDDPAGDWTDLPDGEVPEIGVAKTVTTKYTLADPSKTYYFQIRAKAKPPIAGVVSSEWAQTQTNPDGVKVLAVEGFTATAAGPSSIDLEWTAPTDTINDISFEIEHNIVGPNEDDWIDTFSPAVEATTYTHDNLTPDTKYWYRIRAIATMTTDGSPWTTEDISATTGQDDEEDPSDLAIKNLTAELEGTTIKLAWEAPDKEIADFKEYRVEWKLDTADTVVYRELTTTTSLSYNHTDRTAVGTYTYQVVAVDDEDAINEESRSNEAVVEIEEEEDPDLAGFAVKNLEVERDGTTNELSWEVPDSTVKDFKEYLVEWKLNSGRFRELTNTEELSYDHTDRTAAGKYTYRVAAVDDDGKEYPWSNEDSVTIVAVKDDALAVNDLEAELKGTTIELSWEKPDSTIADFKEYLVEWKLDSGRFRKLTSTESRSYDHEDQTAAGKYTYRVAAVDDDEKEYPWSDEASVTIAKAEDKPSAPREVEAIADGPSAITVSWEEPADSGDASITKYKIESSLNGTTWRSEKIVDATITAYEDTGLDPDETIHYRVSATNKFGYGPVSATVNATTDKGTPSAPRELTATAAGSTITLSWEEPADSGDASITKYKIESSLNSGTTWQTKTTVGAAITAYEDTGLDPDKTIHYRVSATNEFGYGPVSATVSATTERDAPSAPRSLTVRGVKRGNQLTWRAPSVEGASKLTGYRIEQSTDGGASWTIVILTADASIRTYTHLGPPPGQETSYRVIAINDKGDSPPSNVVKIETPAIPPSRPISLRASASGDIVRLGWSAPRNTGGAPITGYRIEVANFADALWATLVEDTESTETEYSYKVEPGLTLSYRVFAINSAGNSPPSTVVRVTVDAVAPAPPTGVGALAVSYDAIGVAWNSPTNTGGSPITGYRIEYSNDGGFWNVLVSNFAATSTAYRHTKLKPATQYFYRIFAINKAGRSGPSEIVNATTLADLPGVPERLTASVISPTQINLTWNEPRYTGGVDLRGYLIETAPDGESWVPLTQTAGDETFYQHKGLTPATTYHYRVTARNEIGSSKVSRPIFARTTAALPEKPVELKATTKSDSEIRLTWMKPSYALKNSSGRTFTEEA